MAAVPPPLTTAALALEQRLREAGHEPPSEAELGDLAAELPALRAAGRAVRVGRSMYAHPEALDAVRERAVAIIDAEGGLTLARACATSSARRAAMRRRCSSTSTPRG